MARAEFGLLGRWDRAVEWCSGVWKPVSHVLSGAYDRLRQYRHACNQMTIQNDIPYLSQKFCIQHLNAWGVFLHPVLVYENTIYNTLNTTDDMYNDATFWWPKILAYPRSHLSQSSNLSSLLDWPQTSQNVGSPSASSASCWRSSTGNLAKQKGSAVNH